MKQIKCRLEDKDYAEFKKKVEMSGLSQQKYIYFAVMSKPIKNIDYTYMNEFMEHVTNIENTVNENAGYIDSEDRYLVNLFLEVKKGLADLWQLLSEKL